MTLRGIPRRGDSHPTHPVDHQITMIRDAITHRILHRRPNPPEQPDDVVHALSVGDVERALGRVGRYGAETPPAPPESPFRRRQGMWPR